MSLRVPDERRPDALARLRAAVDDYEATLERCLVLHAGRSVLAPAARRLLGSRLVDGDLAGRPHEWGEQNTRTAATAIEELASALTQRLFGTPHADYRALTGSLANGLATAALTRPGEAIVMPPEWAFGHRSLGREGYPGSGGRPVLDMPWDSSALGPDLDGLHRLLHAERPRLVVLGVSRTLFPEPLAEVAQMAREVGARLLYDAAHVFGLIAGGAFPNPLTAGFDLVTGSTHKTLPGPTGGAVLCRTAEDLESVASVGDAWLSTYSNARIAALTWTLAEMADHGTAYAARVVANARALAGALAGAGFAVVGAARGFTSTHQVLIDLTGTLDRAETARRLAGAWILVNPPGRVDGRLRAGRGEGLWLRLGSSAVSRLGMCEPEMRDIADLLARLLLRGEDPAAVGKRTRELVDHFRSVHYTSEPPR